MTNTENTVSDAKSDRSYKIKAGIFLGTVAGVSALIGFSKTLASAKKQEQKFLEKAPNAAALLERGASLAMRALGWGTLYAIMGTSALCYGLWKLSGAENLEDFKQKAGSTLPRVPKNETPTSRTNFDDLTDLMKYLSTWGRE